MADRPFVPHESAGRGGAPTTRSTSPLEAWMRMHLPPALVRPDLLQLMVTDPAAFAALLDNMGVPPPEPGAITEAQTAQEDIQSALRQDLTKPMTSTDVRKDAPPGVPPEFPPPPEAFKETQITGRNRGAYEETTGQLVPQLSKALAEPPAIVSGLGGLADSLSQLNARSVYENLYVGDQPAVPVAGSGLLAALGDLTEKDLQVMPLARVYAIATGAEGALPPERTDSTQKWMFGAQLELMRRAINDDPEMMAHPELYREWRQRAAVVGQPPTVLAEAPAVPAQTVPPIEAQAAPSVSPTLSPASPVAEVPIPPAELAQLTAPPPTVQQLGEFLYGTGTTGAPVSAPPPEGTTPAAAVAQSLMETLSGVKAPPPVDVPPIGQLAAPQPSQAAGSGLAELLAAILARSGGAPFMAGRL